jgi:hypothetical protein
MVLVNFRGKLDAYASDIEWLVWASNRLEGKPAALFVVLAGIGISLSTRHARDQVALLQRAAILFGLGMLMLPLWDWDILHFYGVFLALAALWLRVRDRTLLGIAAFFVVGEVVLFTAFDWWADRDATLKNIWFNGLHPVFPWMAFLLLGMWLGRRDLRDRVVRNRLLVLAIVIAVIAECLDAAARPGEAGKLIDNRQPLAAHVAATRSAHVRALRHRVRRDRDLRLHRAHRALAHARPRGHGPARVHALRPARGRAHRGRAAVRVAPARARAALGPVLFFAVGVVASVWWRRRFAHGPLEGLIRRLTK